MIDKTDPTNRDTVPAMLTPGEFVLNKEASTMFAPVIEQMNNAGLQHRAMKNMGGGIQNYNKGGGVDLFDTYFENLLKHEGGWSDQKQDKGGKTNLGITLKTLRNLSDPNATEEDLKSLTREQAKEIYRKHYYYGPNIDSLPESIREQAFDIAVNSGPGTAARLIQELAGVKQDSIIGPNTIKGAEGITNNMLADRRQKFYNDIVSNNATQEKFINGWTNRANSFREEPSETQTASSEPVPKIFSGGGADGVGNFGIIGDFFGGTTTPPVENVSSIPPKTMPNTQANPIAVEQAIMQSSVPQVQAAPPVPTDFGQAFKDARADMGAGGIFTFRGNDYSTNYAEEEDKKMTANMGGSVYLNMGGYPQEYLDNYRKAIMANMGPEYLARTERMGGRDVTPEGIDAARELQAQVRPDYTPGNVAEDSASSEPMAYNDPALKVRSDGMIDLSLPDRRLDKNLYLSQPNTGMTTEESIAKRKNLASNSYVPMPEVNSDESLLQGSSGSVASAARSFPSDYPINMDVPRVEGYNIPVPIPAPRPTMLGGQLYYLNGDGLVTDSNGNPVQDPEIGAAVQDKLNYSAEESAANAQAYNESIAQQNVFNGTNPQSVNPSYDSMRQQQESNAAEAERIRAEIAQIDRERQALNDEFNNREPVVVPPLERGPPLVLESFVPDVPAYEGELGGGNMPLMREDIVQAQQVLNPYDFNPYGNDPMGEIPKLENSDGYTNEELRVLSNTDNAAGSPWAEILQERTERQASELRSELQEAADNGIVPTQSSLNQLSDLERQSRNASEVKAVNDQVVAANQQSVATTNDALGATERERKLRAIERAAEYGITVGDGSSKSSEDVTTKVEGIINNLPEDDKKTSKDQDLAAKEAAAAEEARLNQAGGGDAKNTPEVKGAMSAIKSMFGDLFDTKELLRAAILYLGGRATGLNGNQALAFAGKNYIARTDAKVGAYQKVALEGKHTKDSLAVYKKTMNPADLVVKGQPAIETGVYKEMYHTKSGTPVKLIEKQTSTGRKLYYYKGKQVLLDDFTTDGRYSVGSKDHEIYVGQLESAVISQVKELQEINMTDSDSNGKGSKPIIGITPTGVATQAAKYVIKNQLPREVMRDLVSIAYKDAVAEKKSTGKTPSSLEPFFEKAYVKSRTSNVVNFTLGNGKPAPAASVNQFFRTIRDMATAAEQVENPDFKLSSLNDTQLSTWLLQSKTYTSWNQITDPEEKKFFVDRGAKEVPPRSGFMQYVLEGYPKTS
ncbi:hypothetical protein OAA60_00150 [Porticoccaceae bacterium]|nr:hypothetical protein [Porticoccaceae bacterium]